MPDRDDPGGVAFHVILDSVRWHDEFPLRTVRKLRNAASRLWKLLELPKCLQYSLHNVMGCRNIVGGNIVEVLEELSERALEKYDFHSCRAMTALSRSLTSSSV